MDLVWVIKHGAAAGTIVKLRYSVDVYFEFESGEDSEGALFKSIVSGFEIEDEDWDWGDPPRFIPEVIIKAGGPKTLNALSLLWVDSVVEI